MTAPDLLRQLADCMEEKDALRVEVEALKAELQAVKMKVPTEEQRWFKNKDAAKFIGMSEAFLNKDRMDRDEVGKAKSPIIPFSKQGYKIIVYDRADLEAYIESRRSKKAKK